MPNILILGATGYIGRTVALSLLRSGYTVYGTARSPEKANSLMKDEIIPVEGDITSTLGNIISKNSIDVVIEATSTLDKASETLAGVISAANARRDALAKENAVGPKLGYIYTSGTWVHGSHPGERVSDLTPVGSNALSPAPSSANVAWRPVLEQSILAARDVLDVAIIRPGTIYGRSSWVLDTFWGPVAEAKKTGSTDSIKIPFERTSRPPFIHVDDVAAGYHAVVDRIHGGLGSWPVFDLVSETVELPHILEASTAAMGVNAPIEYLGHMGNPFLEAMSAVTNIDSSRAKTVLGWTPKRTGFVLRIPLYMKAWEAGKAE
ncbi:hypothetical protein FQN53_004932 [Emmonsiellopsis sp. PD_33]|nr:hypothetical protein FQN53_004932 [Emmonsiellopsis sp. PD_33]